MSYLDKKIKSAITKKAKNVAFKAVTSDSAEELFVPVLNKVGHWFGQKDEDEWLQSLNFTHKFVARPEDIRTLGFSQSQSFRSSEYVVYDSFNTPQYVICGTFWMSEHHFEVFTYSGKIVATIKKEFVPIGYSSGCNVYIDDSLCLSMVMYDSSPKSYSISGNIYSLKDITTDNDHDCAYDLFRLDSHEEPVKRIIKFMPQTRIVKTNTRIGAIREAMSKKHYGSSYVIGVDKKEDELMVILTALAIAIL